MYRFDQILGVALSLDCMIEGRILTYLENINLLWWGTI